MTLLRFSPYRNLPKELNYDELVFLDEKYIQIETLRYCVGEICSDSAVKAIHTFTGETTIGFTQRSQRANRIEALVKLNLILEHMMHDPIKK